MTWTSARQRRRRLGWVGFMATLAAEASPKLTGRMEQLFGRPSLYELQHGGTFSTTAREVVRATFGLDDRDWDGVEDEFVEVEERLHHRRGSLSLAYPDSFAVERQTSLLLFGLTRLLQPDCVVETGVADGTSSFLFLAAMDLNGRGRLHSIDLAPDVGALVEQPNDRWSLCVAEPSTVQDELMRLCTKAAPVDLFFHDSDHRFLPQLFEYETFARSGAPGALLVSDDVDSSYAFQTFCRRRSSIPHYLFDARKAAGMLRI